MFKSVNEVQDHVVEIHLKEYVSVIFDSPSSKDGKSALDNKR